MYLLYLTLAVDEPIPYKSTLFSLRLRLYFYQGHERWVVNYYAMRSKILASVPWPVQVIVGNIIYNKNVVTCRVKAPVSFRARKLPHSGRKSRNLLMDLYRLRMSSIGIERGRSGCGAVMHPPRLMLCRLDLWCLVWSMGRKYTVPSCAFGRISDDTC